MKWLMPRFRHYSGLNKILEKINGCAMHSVVFLEVLYFQLTTQQQTQYCLMTYVLKLNSG